MSANEFTCDNCPMGEMLHSNLTMVDSVSVQRLLSQINFIDRISIIYRSEHRVLSGDEQKVTIENFHDELADEVFPEIEQIIGDTTGNARDQESSDIDIDNGISILQCAKRILDKVCVKTQL